MWSRPYLRVRSRRGRSRPFRLRPRACPATTQLCRSQPSRLCWCIPELCLHVAVLVDLTTGALNSFSVLPSPVPLCRRSSASSPRTGRSSHLLALSLPSRAPPRPRVLRHPLQLRLHPLLQSLTGAPLRPTAIAAVNQAPVSPLPVRPPNRIALGSSKDVGPILPGNPPSAGQNRPTSHRLPLHRASS
jgi:hypothetical protein